MPSTPPPELEFQKHFVDYLVQQHGYAVLVQGDITDTENVIVEDHLWAFLKATQPEALGRLERDYGADARDEVFRALRKELDLGPLWVLFRRGLTVRGIDLRLCYPRPRSAESVANTLYEQNRFTVRPHYYFGESYKEVDIVLFLNGLPIVAIELKHEQNQTVEDAVQQFADRDHAFRVFSHPFLYLAADTSDVKAATDPRRVENFRWHNSGLRNEASSPDEYPVEFLYREVLSPDALLDTISFFLVYVPKKPAKDDRPARPAFTIFPRFHQGRMVERVAREAAGHFAEHGDVGRKFLINHSAGSGKTLSICWLADRLHSLYRPATNTALIDIVFILTDRKSLDRNVKDELTNFHHLKGKYGLARKSDDLVRFLKERRAIIVTTQQKFSWVLEEIRKNEGLRELRVAFLIDEAHRSQEGKMGAHIRVPFRSPSEPDIENEDLDDQDEIARIIREHDLNQLFVAFTATPAPATVTLFGEPFDTYSEQEAIEEGYIVDVAGSILSYATLYNLHCPVVPAPDEERVFPKGVVARALKNVAYQDEELIQYKSEVMLRIFDESIRPLIGGRAKGMVVASSRVAGLRYFHVLREKLRERGADYKVLYAFSDFVHPGTNEQFTEPGVNGLAKGELIEERFKGDDHGLMVVANKFQTGFDEPLLAGMFLDKPVVDRNAVQTVSRLNRCHEGKDKVVVVDFTNNARKILKAFARYRKGSPHPETEPDNKRCTQLLDEILEKGVFYHADAGKVLDLIASGTDAQRQFHVNALRVRFQERLPKTEDRKAFVYLLARFAKSYHFLTCFFTYPDEVGRFATFAEFVGPQLIKQGGVSELMKLVRQTEVVKAAVRDQGVVQASTSIKLRRGGGGKGGAPAPRKVTVQDVIDGIREKFEISDDEALFIKQVIDKKSADEGIRETVHEHQSDDVFLRDTYRGQVNEDIQDDYQELGRYNELADPKYLGKGGIFDIMAITVIDHHLSTAA